MVCSPPKRVAGTVYGSGPHPSADERGHRGMHGATPAALVVRPWPARTRGSVYEAFGGRGRHSRWCRMSDCVLQSHHGRLLVVKEKGRGIIAATAFLQG
jgi:hypothetical protein